MDSIWGGIINIRISVAYVVADEGSRISPEFYREIVRALEPKENWKNINEDSQVWVCV